MSDFEDDLQLCEAQTDMLRRICNAINEYGDYSDIIQLVAKVGTDRESVQCFPDPDHWQHEIPPA